MYAYFILSLNDSSMFALIKFYLLDCNFCDILVCEAKNFPLINKKTKLGDS